MSQSRKLAAIISFEYQWHQDGLSSLVEWKSRGTGKSGSFYTDHFIV